MVDGWQRLRDALADRYRVERELGRGGMATVYLAEDLRHHRQVAIKVLDPELGAAVGPERFRREIETVARLAHPHILPLFDSGEAAGLLYYVTPFVAGESLRQRLEKEKQLPLATALRLAREIADARAYAHRHGIVHRDIQPENVLLEEQHALVADFGIARALAAAGDAQLTRTGVAVGTPAYMSTEQVAGGAVDARTDIYGLGCVLYEMLAGQPPFTGPTAESVVFQHLNAAPPRVTLMRPGVPEAVERAIVKALAKSPADRFATGEELVAALAPEEAPPAAAAAVTPARRFPIRNLLALGAAVVLVAAAAGWLALREAGRERVRRDLLPRIVQAADREDYFGAFALAHQAQRALGSDSSLARLWPSFSMVASLTTRPEGARVYRRPYAGADTAWELVGVTPLAGVRFAREGYRLRIEKDGCETVEDMRVFRYPGAYTADSLSISYELDRADRARPGMVHVLPVDSRAEIRTLESVVGEGLGDYWLDRFEVTNEQFQVFVDSGGYRRPEFWRVPFVRGGHPVPWAEAVAGFLDRSGRPGPATWEAGNFPEGQASLPVTGISWYEAAAYAAFAGKSLATVGHWRRAAGVQCSNYIVPASNFGEKGLAPVGAYQGMGPFGVRDMAGNAKEWCWNGDGAGNHYDLGGAWDEPRYMFVDPEARPPWDRSPDIGFRCAAYADGDTSLPGAMTDLRVPRRDFRRERPAPAGFFRVYDSFYSYDRAPLRAAVVSRDSSSESWVRETVSFDAAYGGERVTAYVFLPRHRHPPYQAVMYFPGSIALQLRTHQGLEYSRIDYVVRSGRAVVYPVYKSTYERGDGFVSDLADTSIRYRDHVLMWVKDARRTIDYLETRGDIDSQRIGYLGFSWGAYLGPIVSAVEKRISVVVLVAGGLESTRGRPEVEPLNFLPRVLQPTLMVNGRYDYYFPAETSQECMFRLLGAPASRKRHLLCEAAHSVPRVDVVREVVAWFDRYLGPVR